MRRKGRGAAAPAAARNTRGTEHTAAFEKASTAKDARRSRFLPRFERRLPCSFQAETTISQQS